MTDVNPRHLKAFYEAALFLKDRIERHGWKKWSSNYLREHARCATGFEFTNTDSPQILRALRRAHPELAPFLDIGPLKKRRDRRNGELPLGLKD